MEFRVIDGLWSAVSDIDPVAILSKDDWDDWFRFETTYVLWISFGGAKHRIGSVKIGRFGMEEGERRPVIPQSFTELEDNFFSLGQDDTYYDKINQIIPEQRESLLQGLQDLALADEQKYRQALEEDVTSDSLLRSIDIETVEDQFRRIARGGARLTPYAFSFRLDAEDRDGVCLSYGVEPDTKPPTNIHVLIGSNGVGKTSLLDSMARALVDANSTPRETGQFETESGDVFTQKIFTNVVSVSFSAFDRFEPISIPARGQELKYSYIGLKSEAEDPFESPRLKSASDLADEFAKSVGECRQGARLARWKRALSTLSSDPLFNDWNLSEIARQREDAREVPKIARRIFGGMSSGHAIVLLTITRLVETVAEKTLVLLDEPEAHLHPPLLSAFVRALSDLLIDRNGVAIIATHSPVVLQEVPSSCVWKLRRSGSTVINDRPLIETFGENVGILTREIFGLEVSGSGFHKMLSDSVSRNGRYERVLREFQDQLGTEAKAIVYGLIASQEEDS